ncbi:hypothetical protein EDB81DRAFT_834027 [Dactylonectria macrodidyma]|uniref:Infection structure specific protein n=1 Tax=Dactylonectria macrodidyma TaxID=307937 RepID=A0A9P9I6B0_9HYPO|nr:hypothetical protein EDB81DRAFT_834027 [Dactylonectria macrodidyma]
MLPFAARRLLESFYSSFAFPFHFARTPVRSLPYQFTLSAKMRSAILLAAGATIAAATHPAVDRLEKRDAAECTSVYLELLLMNAPTPGSSLAQFLNTQTQATDFTAVPCEIPTITGSFAEEYTLWASSMVSWYSDQKEGISKLLVVCSDVPEASEELYSATKYIASCDAQWASPTGSSSSSDGSSSDDSNADSSSDDEDDDSSNKVDDNGAGVTSIKAGIALAVAGIAGVIML